MGSRAAQTRERIRSCAVHLFTDRGYAQTSVVEIAATAGVSHMTFFRYFPTKESVVVSDPFDPVIAEVVAAQPRGWSPVRRVVRGLLAAMESADGEMMEPAEFGARIRLAASVPDLRAAMWQSTFETQRAIAAALSATGVGDVEAEAAAGAAIGAATSALLLWAGRGTQSATDTLRRALESLLESGSVA